MKLWPVPGEMEFRLAVMIRLDRIESRLSDPSSAEQRQRVAELEYLLARYEANEEEEDVLEKIPVPIPVVVVEREAAYQPKVLTFPSREAANEWANAYEPQPGEVVHVLETEQP